MSPALKRDIWNVMGVLFWWLCIVLVLGPVLVFALGCAGAATSDISPAKSDAASLFISAPTRSFTEITVTTPPLQRVGYEVVSPAVVEEGEDK